jgi:uncharacterized protein (DUF427 family)
MAIEGSGGVRIEEGRKRVRAYLGGEVVADTTRPRLVWEVPPYPAYYFPPDDVRTELLTPTERTRDSSSRGRARYFTVQGGDRVAEDAAWSYPDSPVEQLRGLIRFDWAAMDAWFEEDEEVFVHPRNPYHRVDVLVSSRHVEVHLGGVKVADSTQPRVLFETGLPPRWYVPLTDVRMDLLRPSSKVTGCPYKGFASYWSVEVDGIRHDDVVWTYKTPLLESVKIAGLACFYDERVDVVLDGVPQERPTSPFA